MSQSSGIAIGDYARQTYSGALVFLSGTKVVVISSEDYVVEHGAAGLEGGITEREGRKQYKLELHGLFYSGITSDIVNTLRQHSGKRVEAFIPSQLLGNYFFLGTIQIDAFNLIQPAGRAYGYYEWILRGTTVGDSNVRFSNFVGARSGVEVPLDLGGFPSGAGTQRALAYNQELPFNVTLHASYDQELPFNATLHPTYNQESPIDARMSICYTDVS